MEELETMGNRPQADQALSVSGAADAFRALNVGKSQEAQAEEKPDASNAQIEGAEVPDEEAEAAPAAKAAGEGEEQAVETFDEKAKRYRVKVDGVESQVSFEELRNGYQRNADYLAKMRKVTEVQQQLDTQRQSYQQRIESLVPQLEQALSIEFADVKTLQDVQKLAETEPARYVKWQAHQMTLQQARAEQERVRTEAHAQQEQRLKEYLAEQHKQLQERLPEWGDAEKGPKLKTDLGRYLKAEGFSDEELSSLADHRLVLVARKAMLFDRAQRERTEAAKKLQGVPKVQKPGATSKTDPKAEETRAAFERLGKTGRVDDAAAVFRGLKLFG